MAVPQHLLLAQAIPRLNQFAQPQLSWVFVLVALAAHRDSMHGTD